MMDCKKALSESDGGIDAAVDWLRKNGLAAAARRPGASPPRVWWRWPRTEPMARCSR